MKKILITSGAVVLFLVTFYLLFLNHVGVNEIGIAYNSLGGQIQVQTNAGWYVTSPAVKVVSLSTLPEQVHLPTFANVIATKIVRLRPEPEHIREFIKLQGFGYSINANYNNILMGYAFSGKSYSFLEVVQDSTQSTFDK